MSELTAAQVAVLEQCAEDHDVRLRRSYSGRGMYGASCVGLVGDTANIMLAILDLSRADGKLAAAVTRRSQRDAMGLESIVYFPGFTAPPGEEEE